MNTYETTHRCVIDENFRLVCEKLKYGHLKLVIEGFGIHDDDPQDDCDYEIEVNFCPICGFKYTKE